LAVLFAQLGEVFMSNVIVPEITADVKTLKDVLMRDLPLGHKVKIPPLNRRALRAVKSLGIVAEVHVRPEKIVVQNGMPVYLTLGFLFFLPYGIYLIFKMKDGTSLTSSVYDIVWKATRKNAANCAEAEKSRAA
jgi:hypothetical protein